MTDTRKYATGRRKTSVARVWVKPGTGEIKVNGRTLIEHFGREALKMIVEQPFEAVSALNQFDVFATVKGGGLRSSRSGPAWYRTRIERNQSGISFYSSGERDDDPRSP